MPAHLQRLTPAMLRVVQAMERTGHAPMYTLSPQAARAAYDKGAGVLETPAPPLAQVRPITLPGALGAALDARLYRPTEAAGPQPTLLYMHGGGFTIGSLDSHHALCARLAALSGAQVISLAYRLAPEHRFPTAFDDCWAALQALHGPVGAALQINPLRLAVGGDSAGGTLACALALASRDARLPLALQLLFYPGCSPDGDTPSQRTYAPGPVLAKAHIDYFFDHYAPDKAQRFDWRFAPLVADSFDNVAPAWLGLAECDPLVDEGLGLGDRFRLAGVPVQLELYPGVTHEFIKMPRAIPEAGQAHQSAAAALRAALFPA